MRKLLIGLTLVFSVAFTKAQTISVSGGHQTLDKQDKGFVQVNVSADLVKNWSSHVSLMKTIGGSDMAMVGVRYTPFKDVVGLSLNALYLPKRDVLPVLGVDVKLSEHVTFALNSSFDGDFRTFGLKVPVYNFK